MKKSLTGVVVLLAGAFVVHSQGTVSMGNYTAFSAPNYMYVMLNNTKIGSVTANPATPTGNPFANIEYGDDWTVELYGAAGENDPASTLSPLLNAATGGVPVTANLADGVSSAVLGTWYSNEAGYVPGTTGPASSATVQIYAWYNGGGTITLAQAMASGPYDELWATSATGNVASLGGGSPPLPPVNIPNLGNIDIGVLIPEPSTIALGVMGALAFLVRRVLFQAQARHDGLWKQIAERRVRGRGLQIVTQTLRSLVVSGKNIREIGVIRGQFPFLCSMRD